jgi:hypothetical protein
MSEDIAPYARPLPEQPMIRNCRFAFRCHQDWKSLETTADPRVRYCHECSRDVLLCQRDAELRAALHANECVAVDIPGPRGLVRTVGVVEMPPYRS